MSLRERTDGRLPVACRRRLRGTPNSPRTIVEIHPSVEATCVDRVEALLHLTGNQADPPPVSFAALPAIRPRTGRDFPPRSARERSLAVSESDERRPPPEPAPMFPEPESLRKAGNQKLTASALSGEQRALSHPEFAAPDALSAGHPPSRSGTRRRPLSRRRRGVENSARSASSHHAP